MTHDIYAYVYDKNSLESQQVKDYKLMFSMTLIYELVHTHILSIEKATVENMMDLTLMFVISFCIVGLWISVI